MSLPGHSRPPLRMGRARHAAASPLRQLGQGTVEAVLAAAAMAGLACAIAWIGRLQFQALEVSQAGRLAAFTAARAPSAARADHGTSVSVSRTSSSSPTAAGGDDAVGRRLALEWLRVDDGLVAAQAQRRVAPDVGWEAAAGVAAPTSLWRHTAVAIGAGHAESDAHTQQRLTASVAGWSRTADASRRLSNALQSRVRNLDAAWGGRRPGDDWVSAWADLAPAGRVAVKR
ncbi:hypothetical protein [Bordetella genomosp. 13]|nr:hypothetical protein [Bordetella genomosp. 13]